MMSLYSRLDFSKANTMPEPDSEYHMVSGSESDSEDEEADFETESSDRESSTDK